MSLHRPSGAPRGGARRRLLALLGAATTALGVLATVVPQASAGPASGIAPDPGTRLYLVTLEGPGTAGSQVAPALARRQMGAEQRDVLAAIGAPEPVYAWTTALSGVAVRLSAEQARTLGSDPRVALVEPDAVRPLAGLGTVLPPALDRDGPEHGGRGVVVGVVDSGLAPESRAFVTLPSLGAPARVAPGACAEAEDWSPAPCGGKLVAARWYVDGFGRDDLRAGSALSPRDDDGHGTQMASIAAGNAGVTVRVPVSSPA